MEEEHLKFKDGIENFDKDKLAKTPTVEKNTLPTKEIIDQVSIRFSVSTIWNVFNLKKLLEAEYKFSTYF